MADIASPNPPVGPSPLSSDPPPPAVLLRICRLPETKELLTLTIPTEIVNSLTSKPCKWLHYVAWTILGLAGSVSHNESKQGYVNEESLDPVEPEQIFFYIPSEEFTMNRVVYVDKSRSGTQTRRRRPPPFTQQVAHRDGSVGAGMFHEEYDACYIFPVKKQKSFLDEIFNARSGLYNPQASSIGYDDVRNGILLDPSTHRLFDKRKVALIRVPNSILNSEDVPCNRSTRVSYPDSRSYRYALHFFNVFTASSYDHPSLDIPLPNAMDDTAPSPLLVT